jgi:hypothetical protein
VRHGLEAGDGQGDRLGDALQGQVAFDLGRLVAFEDHLGGFEGGGRVLGGVEEVLALDVLVEGVVAGVDRLGVDHDVDRAGLGGLVENDGAGVLVEARLLGRVAEVAVREAREGVGAVGDVGFRRGEGQGAAAMAKARVASCFFMVVSP